MDQADTVQSPYFCMIENIDILVFLWDVNLLSLVKSDTPKLHVLLPCCKYFAVNEPTGRRGIGVLLVPPPANRTWLEELISVLF